MRSVTLNLSDEITESLRDRATRRGQSLESYLEDVLSHPNDDGIGTLPNLPHRTDEGDRTTYHRLKDEIARMYPRGRMVAIADGSVVADAASLPELRDILRAQGRDIQKTMLVQAGIELPEFVEFLGILT